MQPLPTLLAATAGFSLLTAGALPANAVVRHVHHPVTHAYAVNHIVGHSWDRHAWRGYHYGWYHGHYGWYHGGPGYGYGVHVAGPGWGVVIR